MQVRTEHCTERHIKSHGHSVLSTNTVCAPVYFNMTLRGARVTLFIRTGSFLASS